MHVSGGQGCDWTNVIKIYFFCSAQITADRVIRGVIRKNDMFSGLVPNRPPALPAQPGQECWAAGFLVPLMPCFVGGNDSDPAPPLWWPPGGSGWQQKGGRQRRPGAAELNLNTGPGPGPARGLMSASGVMAGPGGSHAGYCRRGAAALPALARRHMISMLPIAL